jgi:hypothetical protein
MYRKGKTYKTDSNCSTINYLLMKKFLLGLFAIILAIGFSAFTKAIHTKTKVTENKLYWYNFLDYPELTYDGFQLIADEEDLTGCVNTNCCVCARGYTAAQIQNTNHPENGPINVNMYTTQLNK